MTSPFSDMVADVLAIAYDTEYAAVSAIHRSAEHYRDTPCTLDRDEGQGDEERGADEFGTPTRFRVRVSEVATVMSGDVFIISWVEYEVVNARKTSDGAEWVCECSER